MKGGGGGGGGKALQCYWSFIKIETSCKPNLAILELVTVEGWRERKFAEGLGGKWKKKREGRGRGSISLPPKYNSRWRRRKPDLSSVPFQNNACTAGVGLKIAELISHKRVLHK